jgi:hypothetical protein
VLCGAHRLSVCTTQHTIKTEVHKYTKTKGWLDSHRGSIPHNRSQTKQDISSTWLCHKQWLSSLLYENSGCSDSVVTVIVLSYWWLRGSKTFSYSPVFTVFTQAQDNIFSLNLVLTYVRSPYIMYEALTGPCRDKLRPSAPSVNKRQNTAWLKLQLPFLSLFLCY